jgi:tellurite resistance protein TerC
MKKLFVVGAGFSVLAVGLAMVVLPGPGLLVIPIGLGILAKEFCWARTVLAKSKLLVKKTNARLMRGNGRGYGRLS